MLLFRLPRQTQQQTIEQHSECDEALEDDVLRDVEEERAQFAIVRSRRDVQRLRNLLTMMITKNTIIPQLSRDSPDFTFNRFFKSDQRRWSTVSNAVPLFSP